MAKPLTIHQYTPQTQVESHSPVMKGYRFVNNFPSTVVKSRLRVKPAFRVDSQRSNPSNQRSVIIEQRFGQDGRALKSNISYSFEFNVKRKPGRPRKDISSTNIPKVKRPPGRPRKIPLEENTENSVDITNSEDVNGLIGPNESQEVGHLEAQEVIHVHESPQTELALAVAAATAAEVKAEAGNNNDDNDNEDRDENDEISGNGSEDESQSLSESESESESESDSDSDSASGTDSDS